MKLLLLFITAFITCNTFSQELAGYYITTTGQRVEGFYKVTDFENFENIQFSNTQDGIYKTLPQNTGEYSIGNEYKFKKYNVELDNSGKGSAISVSKDPEFVKKNIYLNVLLEGDATLYSYRFNNHVKYLYSVTSKNIPVKQLIFKEYKPDMTVIKNRAYRQELYNEVRCNDNNVIDYNKLEYTKSALINVFEKFNACTGSEYKIYTNKGGATSEFKITAFAGVTYTTLKLDDGISNEKDSGAGFTIGLEAAYLIPNSEFAGFLRISYAKIKREVTGGSELSESISSVYKADVSIVNLVIGPRYMVTKKLFLDAGLGLGFGSGDLSQESFRSVGGENISIGTIDYDVSSPIFLSLGAGYNITDSFGIDVRYNTLSSLLPSGSDLKLGNMSLNARYTFY